MVVKLKEHEGVYLVEVEETFGTTDLNEAKAVMNYLIETKGKLGKVKQLINYQKHRIKMDAMKKDAKDMKDTILNLMKE